MPFTHPSGRNGAVSPGDSVTQTGRLSLPVFSLRGAGIGIRVLCRQSGNNLLFKSAGTMKNPLTTQEIR